MLWVLPVKPLMTVCMTYPSHWARTWVSGSGRDSVRRPLLGLPGSRAAQQWRAHNRYWNSVWTRHPARAVAAAPCRTPQSLCGQDDYLRIGHTSGTHQQSNTHWEIYTHIKQGMLLFGSAANSPCVKHNHSSQLCKFTIKYGSLRSQYWKLHQEGALNPTIQL